MAVLTPGKIRGLSTASNEDGCFTILAIDHRDAMRVVLRPDDPASVTSQEMTEMKMWLLDSLGSLATAVMLEPEYSAAQAITGRHLPGTVGFLAAVEAQGYLGDPTARMTSLLDEWSVEKAKRIGASGIKLLVLYRPDAGDVTDTQDRLIARVVNDCALHDIPLFLEPLSYVTEPGLTADSAQFAAKRRSLVLSTVERLGALGPDVLKVQFPIDTRFEDDRAAWSQACAELDAVSPVPWALLSGGDPYPLFRDQVRIACAAGASGFMVGRALWGSVVVVPPAERESLMAGDVRPRLEELVEIVRNEGRSWVARHTMPEIGEHWYKSY